MTSEGCSRSPSTSRTFDVANCASFANCSRVKVSGRASKSAYRIGPQAFVIWQEGGEKGQSGHTPGEKRFAQKNFMK